VPERKVYRTTEDILSDPVTRAEFLSKALSELSAFRRRYANLSELATVFATIDNAIMEAKAE
jgi:hypothetical protein